MNQAPLVSICCITYNHAPYIKDCLEGMLQQQTTFPIEILIHDDASTDGTEEIIREYAQRHPHLIFPLYETENKFSQGYGDKMDIVFNYARAKGRYIAYCEGDDYWTDPLKLQRQVDFLESHADYSVCFHRCSHLDDESGRMQPDDCGALFAKGVEGCDITLDMFFARWITQPLTMVFRRSMFSDAWQKQYKYYRDMHEIYHLLLAGKGYIFAFDGGVYRYHSGGIHSKLSKLAYCTTSLPIDKEFYKVSPSKYSRRSYELTLQEYILLTAVDNRLKAVCMLPGYLWVSKKPKTCFKMLNNILRKQA